MDRALAIGPIPDDGPELPRGCVPYLPCPVDPLLRLVEHARVQASDVFVDVGSGLGRAAALVHLMTGARAIGLEIQPALVAAARDMTARLRLPDVTFVEGDAVQSTAALSAGLGVPALLPVQRRASRSGARDARVAGAHAHDPRLLRRPPAPALRLARRRCHRPRRT